MNAREARGAAARPRAGKAGSRTQAAETARGGLFSAVPLPSRPAAAGPGC